MVRELIYLLRETDGVFQQSTGSWNPQARASKDGKANVPFFGVSRMIEEKTVVMAVWKNRNLCQPQGGES